MKYSIITVILISLLTACNNNTGADKNELPTNIVPAVLNYTITNVYPHNTGSYTEGLEWHDNAIYESTGDPDYKGKSKLAKIDLLTGKDIQKITLAKEYFFCTNTG